MSDLIDQVVEVAENADLETTVMEPVKKWVLDKKSAIIGAGAGVLGTLGVTKFVNSRKAKKAAETDEGTEEKVSLKDKIKNKLGKKAEEIEDIVEDDEFEDVDEEE